MTIHIIATNDPVPMVRAEPTEKSVQEILALNGVPQTQFRVSEKALPLMQTMYEMDLTNSPRIDPSTNNGFETGDWIIALHTPEPVCFFIN